MMGGIWEGIKYILKGNREGNREKIMGMIEDIRKSKEVIDHVGSFPEGSFLLPSRDDKSKVVDQSVYGRFDGMQKHELLKILTKNIYFQHREIREVISNSSSLVPRELLNQADVMLGDIVKTVKFEDSRLMTLDEIIQKLIETKDKWDEQKQVGIYYLGIHKDENSEIGFTVWGDELGKLSFA